MAKNYEAINQMRKEAGLEPIVDPNATVVTETKSETEVKPEVDPSGEVKKEDVPIELGDDQLLEALRKRGFQGASLAELNKPTENSLTPEQIADQREAEKLAFGLRNGTINKKLYDSFVAESNDVTNLVMRQYIDQAKKEDGENALNDEEYAEEFSEKYGLTAEAGTRKHKRGQQEIALLGDKFLKEKYNKIYSLEEQYASHENKTKAEKNLEQTIAAKMPDYRKNVEAIYQEAKKITTKFEDDEYAVELVEDSLKKIKDLFLADKNAIDHIQAGTTKEALKEIFDTAVLRNNFPSIVSEIIKQDRVKRQAGTRGIITPEQRAKVTPVKELTPEQKQMKAQYEADRQAVAN